MKNKTGISVMQGTALYVGAVLGTGILLIPALTIRIAGPASIIAWMALVTLSVPLASIFAALGSRYPDSGGVAHFARRAFGTYVGDITGWWFYGGVMMGAPSASIMGGFYISNLFHTGYFYAIVAAFIMLSISITINALGVQSASWSQVIFAAILACLILITIITAIPDINMKNFTPFAPHGWDSVGRATSLIIFSFVGWEAVAPLSQEFRNPQKDIPLSTTLALIMIALLYLGLVFITISVLGNSAAMSNVPIATLMSRGIGPSARPVTAIIATVLTIGTTNAFVGGAAKLGASLARDGSLPAILANGSEVGKVPLRSLSVVGVCSLSILILSALNNSGLDIILHASSSSFAAVYLSGAAAGFILLKSSKRWRVLSVLSFLFVVLLLIFSGVYLIAPAILGLVALFFHKRHIVKLRSTSTHHDSSR